MNSPLLIAHTDYKVFNIVYLRRTRLRCSVFPDKTIKHNVRRCMPALTTFDQFSVLVFRLSSLDNEYTLTHRLGRNK